MEARDSVQAATASSTAAEACAATPAPTSTVAEVDPGEWAYLCGRRHELLFKVQMNRRYQLGRQAAMEFREGLVKVCSLIAGSVAFAKVSNPDVVQVMAAIIFCGTAASMVWGWGNKSRDASRRASQWIGLLRDIQAAGERTFTEAQLDAWAAEANEIEMSEPPPNRRLLEQAHHDTEKQFQEKPDGHRKPLAPAVLIP